MEVAKIDPGSRTYDGSHDHQPPCSQQVIRAPAYQTPEAPTDHDIQQQGQPSGQSPPLYELTRGAERIPGFGRPVRSSATPTVMVR